MKTESSQNSLTRQESEEALDYAGHLQTDLEERIRVEDVVSAGQEVGLSPEAVRAGVQEVKLSQERKLEKQKKFQNKLKWIVRGVAFAITLFGVGEFGMHSSLTSKFEDVAEAHAHVREAIQRQEQVGQLYYDEHFSSERDAELSGSINRVSIMKRRYDVIVRSYNSTADSFFCPLFGMPRHIQYSNEITHW